MSFTKFFTKQSISSKNTSVNTTKFPYIYSHIDWFELRKAFSSNITPVVLDYGCGRKTDHIKNFLHHMGFKYKGYDPYWKTEEENEDALSINADIIICSNVLNVIAEKMLVNQIHDFLRHSGALYFIKVYAGNKFYIGEVSKKDCFQRNEPTEEYLRYCTEGIRKDIITQIANFKYIQ